MAKQKPAARSRNVILPPTRKLVGKAKSRTVASKYDKNQTIQNADRDLTNASIQSFRNETIPAKALRLLARKDGIVGSAVYTYAEIANSGYNLKAFDTHTNAYAEQGVNVARTIMSLLDTRYDYSRGFVDSMPIDNLLTVLLREVVLTGFAGAELVLDKSRFPERIVPVAFDTVTWKSKGDGRKYPVQSGADTGGEEVSLDTATFYCESLHQDLTRAYATPFLEPAIDATYYFQEFIEDVRRSIRANGHSRLVLKLAYEKIAAAAPEDIRDDPEKLATFMEQQRTAVEGVVKGLEPDDSLVTYDSVDVDNIQSDNAASDYTDLMAAVSGMLATSLKTHPSVLGIRLAGSQSLSNVESLVYLKTCRGIQRPVEAVMSRILTLAVRLFGADVYVKFKFNPIDLRPETELEAYNNMKQARILEQLSLGLITDEQAQEELKLAPKPANSPGLSGTFFYQKDNTMADDLPNAPRDPQGETLKPKTPSKAGGKSQ